MARKNQKHRREQRREEAELRQNQYASLTFQEKLQGAGQKEAKKITKRLAAGNYDHSK